eukprot:5613012-Alexandrium_andersonii.AAC.1
MQLFTMPPSETSRSKILTPSIPKTWATDITSPFTSYDERLELQGQDCNAIFTTKNDRWETRGNVLVRVHRCLRQSSFAPFKIKDVPVPLQDLQPERRAIIKDEAGRTL